VSTGDAIVDGLAAYRLTRLVTVDELPPVRAAREKIIERSERRRGHLAYLVTCPYCTGVWVGLGVMAARRAAGRQWGPVGYGLALAAAASFLTQADEHLHDGIRVNVTHEHEDTE
jgi:hypothetical protein